MRTALVAALLISSGAAATAQTPDTFCADLRHIVAAAAETPPFASLAGAVPETLRIGESHHCGLFKEETPPLVSCVMGRTFDGPLDPAALIADTERCLAGRLQPVTTLHPLRQTRYRIAGTGGVEVGTYTSGCPRCEAGMTIGLAVFAGSTPRCRNRGD